jgi:hypothetical protein
MGQCNSGTRTGESFIRRCRIARIAWDHDVFVSRRKITVVNRKLEAERVNVSKLPRHKADIHQQIASVRPTQKLNRRSSI